jgi:hypothetical protein
MAILPSDYPVFVNDLPVPTISGSNMVCLGATGVVYNTQPGMTHYTWNVSAGGTITSGGTSTDDNVVVTWNVTGAQTVSINYTTINGCTASAPYSYDVTVGVVPSPTLTGLNNVCTGATGVVYTTEAGNTNYLWVVSAGGIITAGGTSTDNTVTITWTLAGAESVSVNYTLTGGCTPSSPVVYPVTVSDGPAPTLIGNGTVCAMMPGAL